MDDSDNFHIDVIYEFELISTAEPTINVSEGPKVFLVKDESLKLDIFEKLHNKWENIADLDPNLQTSIKSIRPKFQKILTVLIAMDVLLSIVLVILVETVFSKYQNVIHYSFYALVIVGVLQTIAILWYIYQAMKKHTENMNKWRKLFNNQMIYYVENILKPTYTHINAGYVITMHPKGHKLYVVLSCSSEEDKSSILDFTQVKTTALKNDYTKPLLHTHHNVPNEANASYSSI